MSTRGGALALVALFGGLSFPAGAAERADGKSATLSTRGVRVNLNGAKVVRARTADGGAGVHVEKDGVELTLPSRSFGHAVSRIVATQGRAAAEKAIAGATAGEKSRVDTRYWSRRGDQEWAAEEKYMDRHGDADSVAKVLGLPHARWERTGENSFQKVAMPGRKSSGPLHESSPGTVEGSWTVGKSNGGELRSLLGYLGVKVKRGEKVGLRASWKDHELYVTLHTGGSSAKPQHFVLSNDEAGVLADPVSESAVPAELRNPVAPK